MTAGDRSLHLGHRPHIFGSDGRHVEVARGSALVLAGTLVGLLVARLLTSGLWFLALALVLALPAFVLAQRAPLALIGVWLVTMPFLTFPPTRLAYLAIHRALPIVALFLLFASGAVGIRTRRLSRLGWPEWMIASYVAVTALSVLYTSDDVRVTMLDLLDYVVMPACLYLLVRLVRPTPSAMRWLGLVAAFVIITQALVGAMQWAVPSVLPAEWLGRAGTRTTGSLLNPSVLGVTVLAAGAFVLHAGACSRDRMIRWSSQALFAVAVATAVASLTRAVWIAALVLIVAAVMTYPRQIRRLAMVMVPVLIIFVATGGADSQLERIESRYTSDQTALSRLPQAQASVRMFEQKPVIGWGYDNFDKYDRDFQGAVAGFFPEKDHTSHNLYLKLFAEQGIVGAGLYLGVAIYWGITSIRRYDTLPRSGLLSRKLLVLVWAVLAGHVAVNNFSNMTMGVGLGQWWLLLGLVGALVTEVGPDEIAGSTTLTAVAATGSDARPGVLAER